MIRLYTTFSIFGVARFPTSVYSEMTPQSATLPYEFMFDIAASSITPPTLSKYISIPSGKYLKLKMKNQSFPKGI
ncbi:hypothetical protein Hanom_Chr03g00184021 [Helianthus anomalus]